MNPLPHFTRRDFLSKGLPSAAAAAAAAGVSLPLAHSASAESANAAVASTSKFHEPAQDLPLVHDADVIVCGGGPAGVAAAISAARTGAKVRLFEWRGCLGGVWTAGLLGYLLDFDKPGFARELAGRLTARDMRRGVSPKSICYEPEGMKLLLEEWCMETGVKFQLHTRVAAAFRDGRRLTTIVTESKSGRQAWQAPVFIDATGDGDLGALAGCEWEIGEAKDCPCQPMSLNALLIVKDASQLQDVLHDSGPASKEHFLAEIRRAGFDPSYGKPTLWRVRENLLLVMMNHEYGIKPFDAAQVTEATVRARAELNRIVLGLRKLGGMWEGIQLVATAEQIGVRDGRRIRGRYTVTKEDVASGVVHDDAVVKPTFSVDVHALTLDHNKTAAYSNMGVKVKPYDIPLRALIARDVDGLLMAGRCISGDFISHASYRVTGNATRMGEAAGTVGAIAATSKRLPHEVEWKEAEQRMTARAGSAAS